MDLRATTTIRRPRPEVYRFWRQLENLPAFMAHLDKVEAAGERRSHWTASAPFGRTVEWDAEIEDEVAPEKIGWRSVGDADVPNRGRAWFIPAPDGESTEVHVVLVYDLPGGELGKAVAKYFGEEPHQQLDDDLRRLKQVLEAGEVVRSDARRGASGPAGDPPAPGPAAEPGRASGGTGLMRASCWAGRNKVEVRDVPDPGILNRRDAIVRITSTAICGSDLHLVDGYVPTMQDGDVLGHEFMGEVIETGPDVPAGRLRPAIAWWCRSRSPAGRAPRARPGCTPAARTATPTPVWPRRCSATRWRDVRLLAPDRRVRGRSGAISPGSRSPTSAR